MPRVQFNDGQEITYGDLNNVAAGIEKELIERVAYELANRQTDIVFKDSFTVGYVNATTVSVGTGIGFQTDAAQTDPESKKRLLFVASSTNKTLAAADGTNPRIDIVSIKANRATATSASRNVKDAITSAVAATTIVTETDWASDLLVTTGTPAGSPAVPATPAGYIKLAEIAVVAVTGLAGSSGITDKRPRYKKPGSYTDTAAKTAAYTVDIDDEFITANATGGAFALTLPAASTCVGKLLRIKKIDSSANAITLTPNGSDTLDGASSQTLDAQYTSMTLVAYASGWYIL